MKPESRREFMERGWECAGFVNGIHAMARSRGYNLPRANGSIARMGSAKRWKVSNMTRIADGTPAPDAIVHFDGARLVWTRVQQ